MKEMNRAGYIATVLNAWEIQDPVERAWASLYLEDKVDRKIAETRALEDQKAQFWARLGWNG